MTVRLFALLILAFGFAAPAAAETDTPFIPYTAYSKEGYAPAEYGEEVIVVFHGFLSAMPNGFFKAHQKKLKDRFTVIGYTYNYFDTDRTIEAFDAFHAAHLKDKKTLIYAGTSLGGFWADFFGTRHVVDKIVISNPLVDPATSMMQFVGEHFSEKRQMTVLVTKEDVARYAGLVLDPDAEVPRLMILTAHDELSRYADTFDLFAPNPKTEVVVLSQGGHTLNFRKHFIWPTVEEWIRR